MWTLDQTVRLCIDLPPEAGAVAGELVTIVRVGNKCCEGCPQTYRIKLANGKEWPVLEHQVEAIAQ